MKSKSKENHKEKRDVLFLLTQDLNCPSGLGRYFPLSKNLAKHGFKVSVAALHSTYSSLNKRSFIMEGVKVDYVSQMHVKKKENKTEYPNVTALLWISLKATWKLLIYTLKNPAKTIIIGKPHPMNSLAGFIGGRLIGAKIILDCDDYEAASNYFSSSWQQFIVKLFENTTPKLADHITTNTVFNKERMENLGVPSQKIDYLPNGIDLQRFRQFDARNTSKIISELGLKNLKVIAFIGSLNLANHPVDLLIEAYKIIFDKTENIKLLIIGGGKDLNKLKEFAKKLKLSDQIIFIGHVSPDLVPLYYAIADVTVDPVYETDSAKGRCPLKMFESWATNTPFVTSDVGDRKFLAKDTQSILLAKPGNPEDLAEKIITVLGNKELAARMSENGKKRIEEFYWNNLVTNHLEVFRNN